MQIYISRKNQSHRENKKELRSLFCQHWGALWCF